MPRARDAAARAVRDQRVMALYLGGHSYRRMAADPGVGLSPAGVLKVVRRQVGGLDQGVLLGAFADAYRLAVAGDQRGKVAQRRVMALVSTKGGTRTAAAWAGPRTS